MFLWTIRKAPNDPPRTEEEPEKPAGSPLIIVAMSLAVVMLVGFAFLFVLARP